MGAEASRPLVDVPGGAALYNPSSRSRSSRKEEETISFMLLEDEKDEDEQVLKGKEHRSAYLDEEDVSSEEALLPSCFFLGRPPVGLFGGDSSVSSSFQEMGWKKNRPRVQLFPEEEQGNDQEEKELYPSRNHHRLASRTGQIYSTSTRRPQHHHHQSNTHELYPAKDNKSVESKACESVASTLSMESWSLFSTEDGGLTIATSSASSCPSNSTLKYAPSSSNDGKARKRRSRQIVDVYQTDSTMIRNEQGEDWSPLVLLSDQPRLQLPFRPCIRKRCYCKIHKRASRRRSNSPSPTTTEVNTETAQALSSRPPAQTTPPRNAAKRFLQQLPTMICSRSSQPHRRQPSDDLQGLWIPSPSQEDDHHVTNEDKSDDTTTTGSAARPLSSPTKELVWMIKSHSERNLASHNSSSLAVPSSPPRNPQETTPDCPSSPLLPAVKTCDSQRTRAFSEDLALQQQPRVSPPSPVRPLLKKAEAVVLAVPDLKSVSSSSSSMISATALARATPLWDDASSTGSTSTSFKQEEDDAFEATPAGPARKRADSQEYIKTHSKPTNNVSVPSSNIAACTPTTPQKPTRTYRRMRSRSEDIIDMKPGQTKSTTAKKEVAPQQVSSKHCQPSSSDHRQRARSEDVVDQRSQNSLPTELVVEPPLSDDISLCSSSHRSRRSRSYSREMGTPPNKQLLLVEDEHTSKSRKSSKKMTPPSPTSILDMHPMSSATSTASATTAEIAAVPKLPSQPSKSSSPSELHYQTQLQEYRILIDLVRHGRRGDPDAAARKIIELYHLIACLHFQHTRQDAALCVVNHALERLYSTASAPSSGSSKRCCCLTLAETLNYVKDSMKPLLADLLVTKARILLCSPTSPSSTVDGNEVSFPNDQHVDPCIHEAKYLATTAVSLVQPMMNLAHSSSLEMMPTVAKGLSVLGRTYSHEGFCNPGVAMGHFQQALDMFRFLSQQEQQQLRGSTRSTIWIAETLSHLGHLHLEQGLLDLAKESYWETLQIYRFVYQQQAATTPSTTPCVVLADMATTLSNLGWIHVLEHDLALAHRSTMEALWLLQHYHGQQNGNCDTTSTTTNRSLRNLASVEYQLGMIASRGGQPTQALGFWKAALGHQQAVFRIDHVDVAITMEAIGSSYQQICKWEKARTFLEGAIEIRKRAGHRNKTPSAGNLDLARIQSRLALVLLELNQVNRARRVLSKASKRYQLGALPMDELGCQARSRLARIQRKEAKRLNAY
jgi:tetratricopeptide (TPR) repeat protein